MCERRGIIALGARSMRVIKSGKASFNANNIHMMPLTSSFFCLMS